MKLPPGTEVITFGGEIFFTFTGGALAERTHTMTPQDARIIARRLNEAADLVDGVECGATLKRAKSSPHA